ncbi:hypothetical protein JZ751_010685 [Albula glossodonta]|uniref:Uncharacterized protein n=1 Tax=Albula glossodonta TaxID=121402 RepID=A0A8T2MZU7_9TELE|nr:hypothetical protein JZ751_010685 [Albula glossodonta]
MATSARTRQIAEIYSRTVGTPECGRLLPSAQLVANRSCAFHHIDVMRPGNKTRGRASNIS